MTLSLQTQIYHYHSQWFNSGLWYHSLWVNAELQSVFQSLHFHIDKNTTCSQTVHNLSILFGARFLTSTMGGSPNPGGEGRSYFKLRPWAGTTYIGMQGVGLYPSLLTGMMDPNSSCRLVPGRHTPKFCTAPFILVIPVEKCLKKREAKQTHLGVVILKAGQNLKKENQTRNHRKVLRKCKRPLSVLITKAAWRCHQTFFSSCWKNPALG